MAKKKINPSPWPEPSHNPFSDDVEIRFSKKSCISFANGTLTWGNATLCWAALDLLDAATQALDAYDTERTGKPADVGDPPHIAALRAAVAKATSDELEKAANAR